MHLKLNKDFMKSFKKSDQLEGGRKNIFEIEKIENEKVYYD